MPQDIYDKIMMLAKRRGFIYPSFEIYGGVAGFFDYGPLGSQLKNNLENLWRNFYIAQDNCVEINTPVITLQEVLQASGHVDEFTDLTIDCKKCKKSYKVEDIIEGEMTVEKAIKKQQVTCPSCSTHLTDPYPVNLMFTTSIGPTEGRKAFLRPETAQGIFTNFHLLYRYNREKLPCGVIQIGKGFRNEISPRQGMIRQREFSMAEAEIFFDPTEKIHPKYNEIKKKKMILFDNKDNYRISVEEAVTKNIINNQALAYYMYHTQDFLLSAGIDPKKCRFRKHGADELAHYATECWDAELYSERFGWVECVGIADRSAYDLAAHIKASGIDMHAVRKYDKPKVVKVQKIVPKMDVLGPLFKGKAGQIKEKLESLEVTGDTTLSLTIDDKSLEIPSNCYDIQKTKETVAGEKFVPHVIEPSYGIDRIVYFVLEHTYHEGKKKEEEYHSLKLPFCIAPIKVGVFPLLNEKKLNAIALEIEKELRKATIATYYDTSGSIGRRYARMDEIGTPFCITVDHDTLQDGTVTIRDRDTTQQIRKKKEEVLPYLLSNPFTN